MNRLDLDANATTPLLPEVIDAMRPWWLAGGNAESRHALGRAARRAWDHARETIARCLGAHPGEVIFTSGGTEANNLAILGLLSDKQSNAHVITGPIEHPAVSGPLAHLGELGHSIEAAPISRSGVIDPATFATRFQPNTRLVTIMLANNETGAIQPVSALAALAAAHGIPTHTDAAQAVGRIPVAFHALGVATLAASAHKFHGPCGIGVLLAREGTMLKPRLFGGNQQGGLRPGTPPVALAVGMAAALELWNSRAAAQIARWRALRDRLELQLRTALGTENVVRHGPDLEPERLPQTLCLGFPGRDANALLMQLDLAGVCVSVGSACASGSTQPSPTLVAMNVRPDTLTSSLRVSLNQLADEPLIDNAAALIAKIVQNT